MDVSFKNEGSKNFSTTFQHCNFSLVKWGTFCYYATVMIQRSDCLPSMLPYEPGKTGIISHPTITITEIR